MPKSERLRISSTKSAPDRGCEIRIENMDVKELHAVEAAVNGTAWIRTNSKGRLLRRPAFKALPEATDKDMEPFWRRPQAIQTNLALDDFEPLPNHCYPSISIQHLCGYDYSEENYRINAKNLKEWGFECLRSQRDEDGRYHEVWFMPGLFYAKGDLKTEIEGAGNEVKEQVRAAVSFLCRNASFGTLDVCVQRAAMVID